MVNVNNMPRVGTDPEVEAFSEPEPELEMRPFATARSDARPDLFSDLDVMSYDELVAEKEANLARLTDCRAQETNAEARRIQTGQQPNTEWLRRLYGAMKVYGLRDQAVANRMGKAKRERNEAMQQQSRVRPRRALTLQQQFVNVARDRMVDGEFDSIMDEARDRLEAADATQAKEQDR